MQRLEASGAVRPPTGFVRRQRVKPAIHYKFALLINLAAPRDTRVCGSQLACTAAY